MTAEPGASFSALAAPTRSLSLAHARSSFDKLRTTLSYVEGSLGPQALPDRRSPIRGVQENMGRLWLIPVLLGFLVGLGNVAEACSCGPRSAACGPPEDFWRVGAVFTGRVVAADRTSGGSGKRRIRLRIVEKFRGDVAGPGSEVSVFTDALCGFPFRVGREYFVYARQDQGVLTASVCSRTNLVEQAQRDLAYARMVTDEAPPPGRIVGEVRLTGESRRRVKLLSGIPIVFAAENVMLTATTDAWGRYAVEPPGAGIYVLDVRLPETQFSANAGQHVQFPNRHGCSEINIDVLYDGRVNGLVTDSTGKGIAGLTVSYERAARDNALVTRRRVLTRDDGSYSLHRLSPGPFAIRAELPSDDRKLPGVSGEDVHPAPARAAALGPGERLSLPPLVVPPSVGLARLEGTVHDIAGAPAANARVFLKGGERSAPILGEPAVTDTLGRFVMAVVEGTHYDIFAERQRADRRGAEFSDPVTFTALPVLSRVRLTLRRRF